MEPLRSVQPEVDALPEHEMEAIKAYVDDLLSSDADLGSQLSLSDRSLVLTYHLLTIDSNDRDISLAMNISRNIHSLSDKRYANWVSDMLSYYNRVSALSQFDRDVGPTHLSSLIKGLPSLRRRIPGLNKQSETFLLLACISLLKLPRRRITDYFYEGTDELTLRDPHLVAAFVGSRIRDETLYARAVKSVIEESSDGIVRVAEVESALNASQAASLRKGAL